ncbi:MAG: LPS export ABC transporter permease LptF [Gammaproteobacteria bacterium]
MKRLISSLQLTVVDRYLVREVFMAWLATVVVLISILMSLRLGQYLGKAVAGELPSDMVFPLLGYKALGYTALLMPLALYLGQLLTLGRLYKDSEMAAMFGCGVSLAQVYRALYLLAVPVAALTLVLSVWVAPWATAKGEDLRGQAGQDTNVGSVAAGQFRENADGDRIFYAEGVDGDGTRMSNVFVHGYRDGRPAMAAAAEAHVEIDPESGDRYFVLDNGWRYEDEPGNEDFQIFRYRHHGILLKEEKKTLDEMKREGIPSADLVGSENVHHRSELRWRFSVPVLVLILTLLVVPVGRLAPRQGRYSRMVMGVVVYVAYVNVISVSRVALEKGHIPWGLGLWWVHVLALVLGLGLIVHMTGWRWARHLIGGLPGGKPLLRLLPGGAGS